MVQEVSNDAWRAAIGSQLNAGAINDYRQVRRFIKDKEEQVERLDKRLSFAALETLPPVRRLSSLPEKLKQNEYLASAGLASLAIMNLPEDMRDVQGAGAILGAEGSKRLQAFIV